MSILKDSLKTIILSVLTLLLVGITYAWTEPTDDPPSGNASAPLTVSGTDQIKAGGLVIDSLAIANTAINALTVAGGIKFSDGSTQTSAASGGITKSPAVYFCPVGSASGSNPCWGSCTGNLSLNSSCFYYANQGYDWCSNYTTLSCSFVGYLVQ